MEAFCVPALSNAFDNLQPEEVLSIFNDIDEANCCNAPPVLPKEEVYIFDLGPDESKWDSYKKKFR